MSCSGSPRSSRPGLALEDQRCGTTLDGIDETSRRRHLGGAPDDLLAQHRRYCNLLVRGRSGSVSLSPRNYAPVSFRATDAELACASEPGRTHPRYVVEPDHAP